MNRHLLAFILLCGVLLVSVIAPVRGQSLTPTFTVDATSNPATPTLPDGLSAYIAADETVTLRIQFVLPESTTISLRVDADLGSSFNYVSSSARVAYLADTLPSFSGDFAGIQNQSEPSLTFPASRVNVSGSTASFEFGSVINNDGDVDTEYIIIEYDVVPVVGVVNGTTVNLMNWVIIDEGLPTEVLLDSNQITLFIVEPPGVSIVQSSGSTDVTEGGATDTLTVALTSQPTSAVTITRVTNPQLAINPPSLTFDGSNWNVPQTFTVNAADDDVVEGAHSSSITFTVSSSDSFYDGLAAPSVFVNITDNDNAGITVTPSGGSTDVTEGGAADTLSIVLSSEPSSDVTITLNGTQVTTDPTQITFTVSNWSTPQTVMVTGADDGIAEGMHNGSVSFSVSSSDNVYNGFVVPDVSVNITDNDSAEIIVSPQSGLTTTEAGGTAQFTMVLTSQPTADVTIDLTSSDLSEGTVSPAQVTFTSANWNTAQTITVTGVDDPAQDGNIAYSIVTAAAVSADLVYNGVDAADPQVTTTDDDSAGVTVDPMIFQLTEGMTGSYTIRLNTPPTVAPITILVEFPTDQVLVNGSHAPFTLTFSDTNPQTIPFTVLPTLDVNTNREVTIQHTITNTSAPEYPGGVEVVVTLSIFDSPPPPPSPTCDSENSNESGVVRTGVPDSLAFAINCRVLYHNGGSTTWLGSSLYSEANLGAAGLLDLGVQQAVDIFSPPPSSLSYFEGGFVMCLRGEGTLIWLAARNTPRSVEIIGSYTVPEFPGFTCTSIFEPGTLILVSENPVVP